MDRLGDLLDCISGFGLILSVDQNIAGDPVQLAEKGDPQQAFFSDRDGARLEHTGGGNKIKYALVVGNIDAVFDISYVFFASLDNLKANQFVQLVKPTAKKVYVLGITRAEQTVNQGKKRGKYYENRRKKYADKRKHSHSFVSLVLYGYQQSVLKTGLMSFNCQNTTNRPKDKQSLSSY